MKKSTVNVMEVAAAKMMYRLYPIVEMETTVPLGMGNSVYTLPELPTIGFVRGRTSSSMGARTISTATGWSLKVSCHENLMSFPLVEAQTHVSGKPS